MSTTINEVVYVPISKLTWYRRKLGKGFVYLDGYGKRLDTSQVLRIEKLVIPPAWSDVRINPMKNGHIQAIGVDDKGRRQYIYHPLWTQQKQKAKFDGMVRFGETLPLLRETVRSHMRQHSLGRERVLATVVWLLEHTFIRVGNEVYENENGSYGLTTMREKHVELNGAKIKFTFKGKSGVYHQLGISHPRVSETIRKCLELPGYKIFQYVGEDGKKRKVYAQEVNEYLKQISGEDLSAKDFRTWGGTTLGAMNLYQLGEPESDTFTKKALKTMYKNVSQHLGNTATVCRKYYVHPMVVASYEKNKLVPHFRDVIKKYRAKTGRLDPGEEATWTLLSHRSYF